MQNVDTSELEAFINKAKAGLNENALHEFVEECAKELAARVLRGAIKNTPVVTGTLKKGWTVGNIHWHSGKCIIEVINPTYYAQYVEYGHRKRNGGWVEGQFILTLSAQKVQNISTKVVEARLRKKLKEVLGE